MASVEVNQMLAAAAAACEDKKAEDIRILALDPTESGLSDYFLICTGTNDRQTVAITDEIELRLKRDFSTYPNSVEGRRQGEWILMDYVDFIVHVFLPEKRAYYGLERLRSSATRLSIDELDSEIKAAIAANRPRKPRARATAEEDQPESVPEPARKTAKKAASAKRTAAAKDTTVAKGTTSVKRSTAVPAKKAAAKRRTRSSKVEEPTS